MNGDYNMKIIIFAFQVKKHDTNKCKLKIIMFKLHMAVSFPPLSLKNKHMFKHSKTGEKMNN